MKYLSLRFPEGRKKALTFSYDDGVEQDIRLMEIFNRHGLKATFNLNSSRFEQEEHRYEAGVIQRPMGRKQALEVYGGEAGKNHEIAVHSYSHPFLTRLSRPAATYEIAKDRERLEEMFDRVIRGCAYPMGAYNDATVEVMQSCGIVYARTVESTGQFCMPKDWLRMPATCHHDDKKLFSLLETFLSGEPRERDGGWLFYVWGHAYEFERENNWDRIERFCEQVGGREDIWYATNMEIYDYAQAYNSLQFSMDSRRVKNPSALPVWFEFDGGTAVVRPGETVTLR